MSGPVPNVTALADIYTKQALADQAKRWNDLLEKFQSIYGVPAQFVSRSPGRVNIIGEHIDYSLYSCLAMGMTPDIIIAVSTDLKPSQDGTFKLKIANVDEKRFPTREFDLSYSEIDIDATKHEWTNYFKAGIRGALELLKKKHGADFKPASMQVLMSGTVPAGGGLSSSAAFVSASALAVLVANGEKEVDKKDLTEVAIVSERAVGVNSGGLDQASSILSERGSALLVSFSPSLSARPVFFPKTDPELCFMVAQSHVTSNKQVTGPIHYNLRVVESSMAAAYLNAKLCPPGTELPKDSGPLGVSIRGFHNNYFKGTQKSMPDQLTELIELTKKTLTQEQGYTLEEVASGIGISVDEVKSRFMSSFPVRGEYFKLRQRAIHLFTEAWRVLQFLAILEDPAQSSPDSNTVDFNSRLGELMNESNYSCSKIYECSCPEIDEMCRIAREAGSYGSRQTGAGWGGCSVHLIPADKIEQIKSALMEKYYSKGSYSEEEMKDAIVVSRPMNGSAVFKLDGGPVQ
ncbi:galactokinase [Xylariaceae sp. FL0016]|nr:galactokinase [Xylariaceae sp. FL0016]